MVPFELVWPQTAQSETRSAFLVAHPALPDDQYVFTELYCIEPGCDCRRVVLKVFAETQRAHLATINHGFDPPGPRDDLGQTFLDPLNKQSVFAHPLLALFQNICSQDPAYEQRLQRHYALVKAAVADPQHPVQQYIRQDERQMALPEPFVRKQPKVGRNAPCPCGSGKKYKVCCLGDRPQE